MLRQFSRQGGRGARFAVFSRAFVDTLPILMGYSTMGFAAGVLMSVESGAPFAPLWAGLSAFAFVSGTLSFAIVPALAASESLVHMAVLALCVNFRYVFYGFSMIGRWKNIPLLQKLFLVHSLADEIYALDVACAIEDPAMNRFYCLCNHALSVMYWVCGTTLGAVAGAALPIPSKGIEFAMVALFLVIFTDQMRDAWTKR